MMHQQNEAEVNTKVLREYFQELLDMENELGDIGISSFAVVYDELMDSQKEKLRTITDEQFDSFYESGSIICIGVAYRNPTIDYIDDRQYGDPDYNLWNKYAKEYHRINQVLNRMSVSIASHFEGIPLKATIGGEIGDVAHVHDYFPMVISHRVVAESAGIGWRGKNQLVIHERFSCAIRFSSIIVSLPLLQGKKMESQCGDCKACEDACGYIRHREKLPDYRENCRRYILFLKSKGIEKDICGKCIKACYRSSKFQKQFAL
jgi:epoxyqueuosine reductase QueG